MARSRNIKPGFFTNDDLGELDPLARLLFAGMWTLADREGRMLDRPKKIKAEVLPYDECDAEAYLCQLEERNFILRYEVDGVRYIQVLAWWKHQKPHFKEAPSAIPAPSMNHGCVMHGSSMNHTCAMDEPCMDHESPMDQVTSTDLGSGEHQPRHERAALIPDSLNLIPDTSTSNEVHARASRKPSGLVTLQDLAEQGVDTQHAADWLKVRSKHRAPLTRTAWDGIVKEAHKAGITVNEAVRIMAERSWRGLQAAWLSDQGNGKGMVAGARLSVVSGAAAAIWGDDDVQEVIDV